MIVGGVDQSLLWRGVACHRAALFGERRRGPRAQCTTKLTPARCTHCRQSGAANGQRQTWLLHHSSQVGRIDMRSLSLLASTCFVCALCASRFCFTLNRCGVAPIRDVWHCHINKPMAVYVFIISIVWLMLYRLTVCVRAQNL
jgi:hypothetical protein